MRTSLGNRPTPDQTNTPAQPKRLAAAAVGLLLPLALLLGLLLAVPPAGAAPRPGHNLHARLLNKGLTLPAQITPTPAGDNTQPSALASVPEALVTGKGVRHFAWGDMDADGDLDLAVASFNLANVVYLNEQGRLVAVGWSDNARDHTRALAWGDVDGDGDLDLAVGNDNAGYNKLYLNVAGQLQSTPVWTATVKDNTFDLAWGDVTGDGYLDLVVGNYEEPNVIYANNGQGMLAAEPAWRDVDAGPAGVADAKTTSVELADMDDDGDLDLAVGNYTYPRRLAIVYQNSGGGGLNLQPVWQGGASAVSALAWGDVDNDGFPELALVDDWLYGSNGVFKNVDGMLESSSSNGLATWPGWRPQEPSLGQSVAWGDMDNDGDLDLAIGSSTDVPERVYRNNGQELEAMPVWGSAVLARATTLAWVDIDNDNDLDLTVQYGNTIHVYRNQQWAVSEQPIQLDEQPFDYTFALAYGDMNNDGVLDLAVGNFGWYGQAGQTNLIYRMPGRDGGSPVALELTRFVSRTTSLAWGDVNGDGFLDLAVGNQGDSGQHNLIYLNNQGQISDDNVITLPDKDTTWSVAWGDVDGDGDLDLAVGNDRQHPNKLYLNDNGSLLARPPILFGRKTDSDLSLQTTSVAWGDVDGDGDPDLAVGNYGESNLLYFNVNGTLSDDNVQVFGSEQNTHGLAWGDMNGDGLLDLAVANEGGANEVFLNLGGYLSAAPVWQSSDLEASRAVAWADVDGDGDLDLAVANGNGQNAAAADPSKVYFNEDGYLQMAVDNPWTTARTGNLPAFSLAWADVNLDGVPDLTLGNGPGSRPGEGVGYNRVYLGRSQPAYQPRPGLAAASLHITTVWDGGRAANPGRDNSLTRAMFQAQPLIAESGLVSLRYELRQPDNQPVGRVWGYYSLDGGDNWQPAVATADTPLANLATTPGSNSHIFTWDVRQITADSGFFGQSDQVVLRLLAVPVGDDRLIPAGTFRYPNQTAGPYQTGAVTATSAPFRVRGNQIRVFLEAAVEGQGAAGAQVYRLAAGDNPPAQPLTDQRGTVYLTNEYGYLQGRAALRPGDQLVAMWPVPTDTIRLPFTNRYTLYYLSAPPAADGLAMQAIDLTQPRQSLTVSAENPFILFHLLVSLEWDARSDQVFLLNLADSFRRASDVLFDVTDGQMGIGRVDVLHGKDYWNAADVVVLADNSLRPSAAIGGVAARPVSETVLVRDENGLVYTRTVPSAYQRGQIRMGPVWDPYGASTTDLGRDWWQALAHELSHYLLFLPDNYLGYDEADALVRIYCQGSFMTSTYDPRFTEFLTRTEKWEGDCERSLAERTTGRADWETILTHYPMLQPPGAAAFEGPSILPLHVTPVFDWGRPEEVTTLPARFFDVRELGGQQDRLRLRGGQVYLLQVHDPADVTDDVLVYLGSPIGSGDRIMVRGANAGDRLCLYDSSGAQPLTGCVDPLTAADVALFVGPVAGENWAPEIEVVPLTRNTLQLTVTTALPVGTALDVQVYPAHYGSAPGYAPTATLTQTTPAGTIYTGRVTLPAFDYQVTVRAWPEGEPAREVLRGFLLSLPPLAEGEIVTGTTAATTIPAGPNVNPLGGPNVNPLGGPNVNPLGGPNVNPLGGPNVNPLGGPNVNPLGGPNVNPLGGPNVNPLGGPNVNPLGGAGGVTSGAPFLSADAQVVVYSQAGFFEPNGVQILQSLDRVPLQAAFPWLLPVGRAYHVTLDPMVTGSRYLAATYLQRDVPEGYEETLKVYFLPDGDGLGLDPAGWQPLPTRQYVENLLVAPLQEENGTYAVMSTVAMPPLTGGWNLFAYLFPQPRSVTETLASLAGQYTQVCRVAKTDTLVAQPPLLPDSSSDELDNLLAAGPLDCEVTAFEFGEVYWVWLAVPGPVVPYVAPPR